MNLLKSWLLRLISVSFLAALTQLLLPEGAVRKIARLCTGLLTAAVLLSPLAEVELSDLSASLSRVFIAEQAAAAGIETDSREILAEIIKEKAAAYIWDKAEALGLRPKEITVTVSDGGAYPYPTAVRYRGKYTAGQQEALSSWIAQNLAVDGGHQEWTWN